MPLSTIFQLYRGGQYNKSVKNEAKHILIIFKLDNV